MDGSVGTCSKRWAILKILSIMLCSGILLILNFVFPQSTATSGPDCVYSLIGSILYGKSSSCPTTGTPTVLSDAFGHVGLNNGFLLYDEKLYFHMLTPGGAGLNFPNELTATDQWKAMACQYHYDKNGNFVPYWGPYSTPLSDAQKRVLLDLQANYSVFVCPFTGKPTPPIPPSGSPIVTYSGTVNVMNLGKNDSESNVVKSLSNNTSINQSANGTIINYQNGSGNSTKLTDSTNISSNATKNITLSPLWHFKSGISTDNIKCHNGFELIGKRTDDSPACVSSLTFAKLISRGWGYDPIHEWTFDGLKDTYKAGQEIDFGMKHKGYGNFWCTFPVVIAKYENKIAWQSNLFVMSCPVITKRDFSYSEYEWHVGSNSELGTMILNQTGTYSIGVTWFKSPDIILQKNITITP